MKKTINIVLDILLNKLIKESPISLGDVDVDISVSDILKICQKKRTRRSINLALKELQNLGIITYNPEIKKRTKLITIKNVLFISNSFISGSIFYSEENFYHNLKNVSDNILSNKTKTNIINYDIFIKCLDAMFKMIKKINNGDNLSREIFSPYSFVVLNASEEMFNLIKDNVNNFLMFNILNFPDERENFPDFKNDNEKLIWEISSPIWEKKEVIWEKNSPIWEKKALLYVHIDNIDIIKKENNFNSTYIDAKISQISSKISQLNEKGEKMENYGFVKKINKNINIIKQNPISKNLFESDNETINYEEISNKMESKRSYENNPLSAYKAKHWVEFISDKYKQIRGNYYPVTRKMDLQSLTGKVYPIVFDKYQFSALDFKEFLIELINQKNSQGEFNKFSLNFIGSNEIRIAELENFISKRKKLREEDIFEGKVFIPHWPLTSDNDDLYTVIDRLPKNNLALMYNYGLTVFHRYLQVKYSLTFNEATYFISNVFIKEFYETDLIKTKPEVVERIIYGLAKNSTLWEPYPKNELDSNKYLDFLDWRKKYDRIFLDSGLKLNQEFWWREKQDETLNIIPSVELMFKKRNKNALRLEEISL